MARAKWKTWLLRSLIGLAVLIGILFFFRKSLMDKGIAGYFAQLEAENLAQPFRGVETSDGKVDGLFPIHATGVSTEPIREAAMAFLDALSASDRKKIQFPIDDDEWRKWFNVDNGIYTRQGVSLKEMDETQKEKALALMATSLSAKGLQLSKDIMKTDQTLRELNGDDPVYDEELYFFTLMGEPSIDEPWGWQIDGHHLVINYFVLGDQVVMTPTFLGGEPIITTSGKYAGNTLFQDEQNLGLQFMQALPPDQQAQATLSSEKVHNDNKAEAAKDNVTLDYEGLNVGTLPDTFQQMLLHLAGLYIHNMREGHSDIKMSEIEAHLDQTWFAWVGKTDAEAVFYYRIHSPVILIEFDHQHPVGVPGTQGEGPSRNHIHTVIRTPNGNDYGKDLLQQHLEAHPH